MNLIVFPALVTDESLPVAGGSDIILPSSPQQHTIVDLMTGSGPLIQGVLVILAIMSVMTWGIVITKWFQIRRAKAQSGTFSEVFWGSRNLAQIHEASRRLTDSPVAKVYAAGHRELTQMVNASDDEGQASDFHDIENVDRALKRAKAEELTRLERGTTFLATVASAAPFIGLFGTVWGLMHAFIGISQAKSSSIQAVAPGISEALITTAIGLAAAIPASIFFNYFMQQVRVLSRSMDMFSAEFLNIARRHFLK